MADGIAVEDQHAKGKSQDSKRWLFRVYDPATGRRKSKAFDRKQDGWEWAHGQRNLIAQGEALTGPLAFERVIESYVGELRRAGLAKSHVDDVERVLRGALKAGAADMRAPSWGKQVMDWLGQAEVFAARRLKKAPSAATRNKWLTHLRAATAYAIRKRWLIHDPLADAKRFKAPAKLPRFIPLDALRRMVSEEMQLDPFWLPACCLVYTGCRADEGLHLRWDWIDWQGGGIDIRVHPEFQIKRDMERVVPLQPELRAILEPLRRPHGWVIEDAGVRSMGDKTLWQAFKAYLGRCGLVAEGLSPHSTRHSWIGLMIATGVDMATVKRAAGHRQISTTDRYADGAPRYMEGVKGWERGVFRLRG